MKVAPPAELQGILMEVTADRSEMASENLEVISGPAADIQMSDRSVQDSEGAEGRQDDSGLRILAC